MAIVPYAAAAAAAQKTLSPSALRSASRQTEGMLRIPSRLQSAIDNFLGGTPPLYVYMCVYAAFTRIVFKICVLYATYKCRYRKPE